MKRHSRQLSVYKQYPKMKHIVMVLSIQLKNERRYQVRQFVEKPAEGTAPSNLAIMGRYVLTPEIFMFLEDQQTGAGGEIQLTDAIQRLNEIQRVFAYDFEGIRYDVGEKFGFIKTTIEMALQNEELNVELMKYMKELVKGRGTFIREWPFYYQ